MDRELTDRERSVLDALLSVEFEGAAQLRAQADTVRVVGLCGCGCPSIDFHVEPGTGMGIRVNASIAGSPDELFLFTLGDRLGGIEYVGLSGEADPAELPDPALLELWPAGP